jgi:hypothetical protein
MQRKRIKVDPSAPIDPDKMTLDDVIRHANANANIAEQDYKRAKKAERARLIEEGDLKPRQPPPPPPPVLVPQTTLAPQLVLRDGKIVLDEDSLRVQVCKNISRASLLAYQCGAREEEA